MRPLTSFSISIEKSTISIYCFTIPIEKSTISIRFFMPIIDQIDIPLGIFSISIDYFMLSIATPHYNMQKGASHLTCLLLTNQMKYFPKPKNKGKYHLS